MELLFLLLGFFLLIRWLILLMSDGAASSSDLREAYESNHVIGICRNARGLLSIIIKLKPMYLHFQGQLRISIQRVKIYVN